MNRMTVAGKQKVKELLSKGFLLEFSFYAKAYVCDENFKRINAIKFTTYLKLLDEFETETVYKNASPNMTDSKYYKIK